MQITRTDTSPTSIKLSISLDAHDLEPIKQVSLSKLAYGVSVPGFRKGKAPLNVIEKHIDQQKLFDDVIDAALNSSYSKAIDQEKLRPVANPQVTITSFVPFSLLTFDAQVDIIGPIKLADYKKVGGVKKKTTSVTAKDVDEVVANLRKRQAKKTDVDRVAKDGDEVWIDFSGSDSDNNPIAGADGKDYPLLLGSKTFIPGFEDNVIGMKPGDEKSFTIKFPDDYGVATLQSKDVTFKVTAKKVQELSEPELNDDFAAEAGPFKTVAELKADIKKQIQQERQWQTDRDYENDLIRAIAGASTLEVPKQLVDEQIARIEENEKQNLMYRGQTWQEHLDAEGQTAEEHAESKRPEALERVRAGLVLSEIAEKEGIDVTPQELDERIAQLKTQYQDQKMQAELDSPNGRRDIAARLMTEKTIAKIVSYNG